MKLVYKNDIEKIKQEELELARKLIKDMLDIRPKKRKIYIEKD